MRAEGFDSVSISLKRCSGVFTVRGFGQRMPVFSRFGLVLYSYAFVIGTVYFCLTSQFLHVAVDYSRLWRLWLAFRSLRFWVEIYAYRDLEITLPNPRVWRVRAPSLGRAENPSIRVLMVGKWWQLYKIKCVKTIPNSTCPPLTHLM